MQPSHPCFLCGHRTVEECLDAGTALPPAARAVCGACGHLCVSSVSRQGPLSPGTAPSRPGRMASPGKSATRGRSLR